MPIIKRKPGVKKKEAWGGEEDTFWGRLGLTSTGDDEEKKRQAKREALKSLKKQK
jgi:hypothetical protein